MANSETRDISFGSVLRDLGHGASELIHNELALIRSDIEMTGERLARHGTSLALWGGLLALSTIPFLAFLVIALGRWLDGRYWLSSLIVAVVCGMVSGWFTHRNLKLIRESDLNFKKTKQALKDLRHD